MIPDQTDLYSSRQYIETNGVLLHTVFAGPADGEPVILLHGFPEFWYGWRHQMEFLAEKGYRVIVPDQRGYNMSDKPKGVSEYRISTLARDIVGLADELGYDTFYLVGHDWGAAVSWWVATMFPERLKKLVILNVPYPTIMLKEFRKLNLNQLLKSWYMFFFQIPGLPEFSLKMNDFRGFAKIIQDDANPGSFTDKDLEQYREAWGRPGAITAMLNWYRAMVRGGSSGSSGSSGGNTIIKTPTLMLWGEQDIALDVKLAHLSIEICENGILHTFPDATHWLQHDKPDEVNEHIHKFLSET